MYYRQFSTFFLLASFFFVFTIFTIIWPVPVPSTCSTRMDKFLLLRDRTGLVQLRLPDDDVTSDRFGLASLPLESVVVVRGRVRQRPAGQENGRMATGRVEVELTEVISANPAKPNLPFQQTERIKPKVTKINNLKVFEQESWIRPFFRGNRTRQNCFF